MSSVLPLPTRPAATPQRGRLLALALALALVAVGTGGAGPAGALGEPLPWPLRSDNVTWHGTVPLDFPGVGGKVVDHADGNRYFYANGGKGITVYDIADPLDPVPVGRLAFPYSQGENLQVSDDGTRAVLAADGFLPYMPNYVTLGVHVVDLSDPTSPTLVATTSDLVAARGPNRGTSEHTVACADAACSYAYGSTTGNIYDLTGADEGVITVLPRKWNAMGATSVGSRHALNRDESGLLVADTIPRLVIDTQGTHRPGASPTNPAILATGAPAEADADNVQHNNVRVGAQDWRPRPAGEPVATQAVEPVDARSTSLVTDRPVLRPGELLIGTSESNVNPRCTGTNGGISTWSMVNFDKGAEMVELEFFAPYNGTWVDDGAPAAQWAGCSAHWFDVTDDLYVAASWYEHGTRFFRIGATTGTIEEVGWFQSVQGISAASYWVTDDVVYSVDGTRGIDILSFDRDPAKRPGADALVASWLLAAANTSAATTATADQLRLYCRLAVAD